MKRILVPTDFSAAAHLAGKYTASLARVLDAEVFLLHAYMEMVPAGPSSSVWILTSSTQQEEKSMRIVEEVKLLANNYAVHVSGEARIGYRTETILQTAAEMRADLIVMGTETGKKHAISGNTTLSTDVDGTGSCALHIKFGGRFGYLLN